MSNSRKKRMSILDNLAAAGAPAPPTTMMQSNRALRSARDAVDGHNVWELDPAIIDDARPEDRLEQGDVADLRDAIEANGQTVPILVRRHPDAPDRYLLVYGRRRLEAIRQSDKVDKVRALVASLDDTAAVRAQISENMARRDLSYIEKALFATSLVESGYGTQSHVAEILTVTKSSISMALAIVDLVGRDLVRAIGPAHGVGRPRWDALGKGIEATGVDVVQLIDIADKIHDEARVAPILGEDAVEDPSRAAFDAVMAEVEQRLPRPAPPPAPKARPGSDISRGLTVDGVKTGVLRRTKAGLRIDITESGFADWLDREAETVITELHARWKSDAED